MPLFLLVIILLCSGETQPLVNIGDVILGVFNFGSVNINSPGSASFAAPVVSDDDFFTIQPVDCIVVNGTPLIFSISFSFDGSPYSIRWQYQPPGYSTWFNSQADSAKGNTLCYTAALSYSGRLYRCVITNMSSGEEHISAPALLTVLPN